MADILIEQALFIRRDGSPTRRARSPGFADDWMPEAEQLCTGFGERIPGVACPDSVFALPFQRTQVAIVQVADQADGSLGFRILVLSQGAYRSLDGDPFAVAEVFPPSWQAQGELSTLVWSQGPPAPRTVAMVQQVLKREEGGCLLGGTQALLDGNRLAFERPQPDPSLLRGLWTLLPTNSRCELWPASFAFGNALGFHAVVVPRKTGDAFADYLTEDQAAEYPEGRYELSVQVAAEQGDEAELHALFNRRTRAQTWRLGLMILCLMLVLVLVMNWFNASLAPPARKPAPKPTTEAPRE